MKLFDIMMMKLKAKKSLFGTRQLSILTAVSFVTVLICLISGVLLSCDVYASVLGNFPSDKTDPADWARMFALFGLILVFAMVGVFIGSFLSMVFAKLVLKLPKDIFVAWIDASNGESRFLRRWNQWWIECFYN